MEQSQVRVKEAEELSFTTDQGNHVEVTPIGRPVQQEDRGTPSLDSTMAGPMMTPEEAMSKFSTDSAIPPIPPESNITPGLENEQDKPSIIDQLGQTTDGTQALSLIREHISTGGSLEEIKEKFASNLTEAEGSSKLYRADIAAALETEESRLQSIEQMREQILAPDMTVEAIKEVFTSYEQQFPDRGAKDLLPTKMSAEQKDKLESAQTALDEETHAHEKQVWQSTIDAFVTEQDKELLRSSVQGMQSETVDKLFDQIGIPEESRQEAQQIFETAATQQVTAIEQQEAQEQRLHRNRLILTGILFTISPHFREQLLHNLIKDQVFSPVLKKIGFSDEQLSDMLAHYSPTSELVKLPFRQFDSVLHSLDDKELYAVLKSLSKERRVALVSEHEYEGKKLGSEATHHLEEFLGRLPERDKKVLGIYQAQEASH